MFNKVKDILETVKRSGVRSRVVIAGAADSVAIESINDAQNAGFVEPVLVGDADAIKKIADENQIDIRGYEVVNRFGEQACVETALTMVKQGDAGLVMKGNVQTGALLSGALDRRYGLRTDRGISHLGVFDSPLEERLMIITDAGLNVAPDLTRKRDIILNASDVAKTLGIALPKVALLSFLEKANDPSEPSFADAIRLEEMNLRGKIPGCVVEGPFALDNAVSAEAAKKKKMSGKVAGKADILVAHNIQAGNALYKALQVWQRATIAAVTVGCRVPLIVPSRVDTRQSKLESMALAVLLKLREEQMTQKAS